MTAQIMFWPFVLSGSLMIGLALAAVVWWQYVSKAGWRWFGAGALIWMEPVIAILCHTASRTLVFRSVAGGGRRHFWCGFLLMTAMDAVAGWTHLTGFLLKHSVWWVELWLLPFAVLSVFLIPWARRTRPAAKAANGEA